MYKMAEERADAPTLPPGDEPDNANTDAHCERVLHDSSLYGSRIFARHATRATVAIVSVQLFNGTLTPSFQPTKPLLLADGTVALAFLVVVTGGIAASVDFYLEYTDGDPNAAATQWFREVDEQDVGLGVISMSQTIRTFQLNDGGNLPAGMYGFSPQFKRLAQFVRVQIRASAGTATAQVTAPFGSAPVS